VKSESALNIHDLMLTYLGWYTDILPIDISKDLPRHPTKNYSVRSQSKIKRIVVHTSNWNTTPEKLAKYDITPYYIINGKKYYNHISRTGCPAITYHECFMDDGTIYYTLPYEETSWHVGAWNPGSLAFCMMYVPTDKSSGVDVRAPSENMIRSIQVRLGDVCLHLRFTPDKIVGHRELSGTGWYLFKGSKKFRKTCPGMLVDLDQLRLNVSKYMQIVMKCSHLYKGKIDGDFGPKSQAALVVW